MKANETAEMVIGKDMLSLIQGGAFRWKPLEQRSTSLL